MKTEFVKLVIIMKKGVWSIGINDLKSWKPFVIDIETKMEIITIVLLPCPEVRIQHSRFM